MVDNATEKNWWRPSCLKFILAYFQPIRIEYSKISAKSQKSRSKQTKLGRPLVRVNMDRLYNKQMNENKAGSNADWNNFNISRIPLYEKWKNKKLNLLYLHQVYILYYDFLLILTSILREKHLANRNS